VLELTLAVLFGLAVFNGVIIRWQSVNPIFQAAGFGCHHPDIHNIKNTQFIIDGFRIPGEFARSQHG